MAKNGPVILVRKETTPDDIHGMDVAKGILTARRRQDQPRGRGRARHGHALRRRRRRHPHQRAARRLSPSRSAARRITVKEGDWISLDGTTGEVYLGKAETIEPIPTPAYFGKLHEVGRRVPRQVRRARQRRYSARRQSRARSSAPKASACAAPSTCSSPRIASPHVQAMILARDEKIAPQGAAEAAAHAAQGFRRPVQGDGRLPGGDPHARSAAARVPAQARRPDGGSRPAAVRRRAKRRRKCRRSTASRSAS